MPSDVYDDYFKFLNEVAEWIAERARSSSKRSGLACEAIQINGNKVWGGVGVYTVCELFMDSGKLLNVYL